MSEIKCHLYDIVRPQPNRLLSANPWQQLFGIMSQSGWIGDMGERYGVVDLAFLDNMIVGYFANEGQKTGYQYDENKELQRTEAQTFEHILFCLFTDTAQLLLQHRSIFGYDNLGFPIMRANFLGLLAEFIERVGISVGGPRVHIEPARTEFTQQQMLEFFRNNSVVKLEVKRFNVERIPRPGDEGYQLFNPRAEWDEITWHAVEYTIEAGAKEAEIDSHTETAELNRAPLAKAMAQVGDIEEVHVRRENGNITVRKKTEGGEVSLDLPRDILASEQVAEIIIRMIDSESRQGGWQSRQERREQDGYKGTMFDDSEDSDSE